MPLLDDLEGLSFRLFGHIAPKFLKNVYQFRDHLEKARITIYPETYVSLMLLFALLTVPVSIVAILLAYFFQFLPLLLLAPMPAYIIIGFIVMPMSMASERASTLEREMPFAATYITVMASGGIPPFLSFKRLSEADLMPAMRKEAKDLTKDVEIFGVDPLTALEKSAKKNPLDVFREFVSGYASTVIIGGDVLHFLEMKAEDIFKERSSKVRTAAERLGTLLESFIIIMVLMSLCFYILFSVESIYSTGMATYSTMLMYTYVLTPLLSFVFIYLAHSMQPKTPIKEMRPYKVYALSCVAAAVIILMLTSFFGLVQTPLSFLSSVIDLPTAVAIGLVVSAAPAAIVHHRIYSKKSSLEKGVAIFLRDLTETRKSGLAPEKCIENLSERDYGEFTKELKNITAELSWGVPLRKVFMDFVKRTKSWLTQIVMFLLVEAIDVGGGTIAMIESLTRFNTMTQQVEKEKKMAVRPYVMVPYFAAVLLVATTLMTLIFTSQTLTVAETGGSTLDIEFMTMIFSVSVIMHSYLIGLVAGKISEEALSAGFKHAALLVIIAIVASKFVPAFFGVQTQPT